MNQISFRIALAMLPALVLVLLLFGVATAMREGDVIELEMQRDADAVALSLAEVLRHEGVDADGARAHLESVDEKLAHLAIRLADDPVAAGNVDGMQVVGVAPLETDGRTQWVVVTEPLQERDAFVLRALLADAVGSVVATLVAWAFAVAVGRTLVQSRVIRLIHRLEAVGRGEYRAPPLALGADELGVLGEAVDRMAQQIEEARAHAQSEAEARQRVLLQLRRADRLAAVGRTVAVFAHEVGTPLGVIVGRAERLERPVNPDGVRNGARIIHEQADRIAAFVRRLLDYARHDDTFELAPLDLGAVVRRSTPMMADRGRARGVAIETRLPGGAPIVDGDAKALEQVVVNLLANAIDASPADATVTVRIEPAHCDEAAERGLPSDHLHLVVEDRGPGIPIEVRPRVFDPFFSTKAPGEGTGLGLAIVAEIVQDHAGAVTVEDRDGGGCRIVVHLPTGGKRA